MLAVRDALVRRGQFVLRGDFLAAPGELHAVVGRNGGGKTTWLMLLAGRIDPAEGQVRIGGEPSGPPRVALLPARAEDAVLGARRLLEVELTLAVRAEDVDAHARLSAIERVLDLPTEAEDGRPEMLYRALCGLLAMRPQALLLDEPTSRIGPASRVALRRALLRLRAAGLTVVTATHDPELALCADKLWLAAQGRIRETSLREAVDTGAIRAPAVGGAFPGLVPLEAQASSVLRLLLQT